MLISCLYDMEYYKTGFWADSNGLFYSAIMLNKHLIVNCVLKRSRFLLSMLEMNKVLLCLTKDCRIKCLVDLRFDSEVI